MLRGKPELYMLILGKKYEINNLSFHLRKLEKEEQMEELSFALPGKQKERNNKDQGKTNEIKKYSKQEEIIFH